MYESLDVAEHRLKPPSALLSLSELPRVLMEATTLIHGWPMLACAARGDGHPVLVLPGFIAGDESTVALRRFLTHLGYDPLPWALGRNTGSLDIQRRMFLRFKHIARRVSEPVTLIGQSLGGVFARQIARRFPADVRQIITLASPFGASDERTTNPLIRSLFERMSGLTVNEMRERMGGDDADTPPPAPATAIYSKTDGVVAWHTCIGQESATTENVEIIGSHSGMAINPAVLYVIADRLAQAKGAWSKFDRTLGLRPWFFPTPATREA